MLQETVSEFLERNLHPLPNELDKDDVKAIGMGPAVNLP